MGITSDRNDPGIGKDRGDGQNESYLVLSDEERAKGFVRPVRTSYEHVGIAGPDKMNELRDLTEDERKTFGDEYAKFEVYPEGSGSIGRFWEQSQLDAVGKGCRTVTTMSTPIAETYAREPGFYGRTFCCGCGTHLPVGKDGEFVWTGTNLRVGT